MVKTYDVYLAGKVIDRVYMEGYNTESVRLEMISRHGLPVSIMVKGVRERKS